MKPTNEGSGALGVSLTRVGVNHPHRVASITAQDVTARRLSAMGLFPGAIVEVLQHHAGGPLIIRVGASRIGIERAAARGIRVLAAH